MSPKSCNARNTFDINDIKKMNLKIQRMRRNSATGVETSDDDPCWNRPGPYRNCYTAYLARSLDQEAGEQFIKDLGF